MLQQRRRLERQGELGALFIPLILLRREMNPSRGRGPDFGIDPGGISPSKWGTESSDLLSTP